ncbi:hypothetical protein D3C78_1295010 [compost metagenome]
MRSPIFAILNRGWTRSTGCHRTTRKPRCCRARKMERLSSMSRTNPPSAGTRAFPTTTSVKRVPVTPRPMFPSASTTCWASMISWGSPMGVAVRTTLGTTMAAGTATAIRLIQAYLMATGRFQRMAPGTNMTAPFPAILGRSKPRAIPVRLDLA